MALIARLTRRRLADPPYLAFPLRINTPGGGDPLLDTRTQHVRGLIEQVLFTVARERGHRPEFGAGVKALLFEPNAAPLWQVTERRLSAALAEVLTTEVDPKSLEVSVGGEDAQLVIRVAYTLAAIGRREEHIFNFGGA